MSPQYNWRFGSRTQRFNIALAKTCQWTRSSTSYIHYWCPIATSPTDTQCSGGITRRFTTSNAKIPPLEMILSQFILTSILTTDIPTILHLTCLLSVAFPTIIPICLNKFRLFPIRVTKHIGSLHNISIFLSRRSFQTSVQTPTIFTEIWSQYSLVP